MCVRVCGVCVCVCACVCVCDSRSPKGIVRGEFGMSSARDRTVAVTK